MDSAPENRALALKTAFLLGLTPMDDVPLADHTLSFLCCCEGCVKVQAEVADGVLAFDRQGRLVRRHSVAAQPWEQAA